MDEALWLLQIPKTLLKISNCNHWFKVDECVFDIPHRQHKQIEGSTAHKTAESKSIYSCFRGEAKWWLYQGGAQYNMSHLYKCTDSQTHTDTHGHTHCKGIPWTMHHNAQHAYNIPHLFLFSLSRLPSSPSFHTFHLHRWKREAATHTHKKNSTGSKWWAPWLTMKTQWLT